MQQPLPAPNQMPPGGMKHAAMAAQFQQQRQLALQRQNSANQQLMHPAMTPAGCPPTPSAVYPGMSHQAKAAAAASMFPNTSSYVGSSHGYTASQMMAASQSQSAAMLQQQQQQQQVVNMQLHHHHQQQQQAIRPQAQSPHFISANHQSPSNTRTSFNYPSQHSPAMVTPGGSQNISSPASVTVIEPNQSPAAVNSSDISWHHNTNGIPPKHDGASLKNLDRIATPPKNEELRLMFPQEKQILIEPFQIDHEKGRITRTFFINETMGNKLKNVQSGASIDILLKANSKKDEHNVQIPEFATIFLNGTQLQGCNTTSQGSGITKPFLLPKGLIAIGNNDLTITTSQCCCVSYD